jgi:hypothetical protein
MPPLAVIQAKILTPHRRTPLLGPPMLITTRLKLFGALMRGQWGTERGIFLGVTSLTVKKSTEEIAVTGRDLPPFLIPVWRRVRIPSP